MLNLFLRILPWFVCFPLLYLAFTYIIPLEKPSQFIAVFLVSLGIFYPFSSYNVWMMKRTGSISSADPLDLHKYGHVLLILGAICLAYGFIVNNRILMFLGCGSLFYGEILLSRKRIIKSGLQKRSAERKNQSLRPQEAALLRAIDEKKKEDPLAGIKIGSKEILQQVTDGLKNDKGVHIESLLGILGSLAGYSCHAAIREELVDSGEHIEKDVFTIVGGQDGRKYYFGDLPNKPLAEDQLSIWGIVAGISQHLDKTSLPDINAIFSHVASTVGTERFGIPDISKQHKPNDIPLNYLKTIWLSLLPTIDNFCDRPMERPILLGLAAQQAIEMGKDIIAPTVAAELVMQCAIPMSKIGPEWLT